MDIGNHICKIRKEHHLTQEEFGSIFHVTRQTVSNWENKKSFPDLQTLIEISNRFDISMDTLLKGDTTMVKAIDKERSLGALRRERAVTDFFTGAGTGILASCLFSPHSASRTLTILIGFSFLSIGWYKKARYDKRVIQYVQKG